MSPSILPLLLGCSVTDPVPGLGLGGGGDPPPFIRRIDVSPRQPVADSVMSAVVQWDGDRRAEVGFAWKVDGVLVSSEGISFDGEGHLRKGSVVELTLTVRDDGGVDRKTSAPVTVVNSPPWAPQVSISPGIAYEQDDLVCHVFDAVDIDLDPLHYTISWQVDGQDYAGESVPYTDTRPGQTWTCIGVANDGEIDSPPSTSSVDIEACQGLTTAVWIADAPEGFTLDTADLDGDGDDDIIAGAGSSIFWVESMGNGSFGVRHPIDTQAVGPSDVTAADFDGDGDLDVAASSQFDDEVTWWANDSGSWTRHPLTNQAAFARGLHVDDLDGDGDIDLLYAADEGEEVGWFENLGGGSFAPAVAIGTEQDGAHAIATFDVEGDGDVDVVLGSFRAVGALVWFEQLPDGRFAEGRPLTDQLGYAVHITSGDLDGDGDEDVLAAALLENRVAWIENLGDGTWGLPVTLDGTATTAHAVLAYDIDLDGDLDVASAARDANEVVWFENLGAGVFSTKTVLGIGSIRAPVSVAAGDLDGDGDIDLTAIAEESDEVAWFENACR